MAHGDNRGRVKRMNGLTKEVTATCGNITLEEYNKICDELEDKLCVGSCGWCV